MTTTMKRTNSEIERDKELTRVEREHESSTSSCQDDPDLHEEPNSDTEDVFENAE